MKGLAYIFLRKDGAPIPAAPAGWFGHVGWGFARDEAHQSFYFGSTENPGGSPLVLPGRPNGWWGRTGRLEEMLREMETANEWHSAYDAYKVTTVRNCDPERAAQVADIQKTKGYTAITNNCLDHAWNVLFAYNVRDLPLAQFNVGPSTWFALFNGEYHNL